MNGLKFDKRPVRQQMDECLLLFFGVISLMTVATGLIALFVSG